MDELRDILATVTGLAMGDDGTPCVSLSALLAFMEDFEVGVLVDASVPVLRMLADELTLLDARQLKTG